MQDIFIAKPVEVEVVSLRRKAEEIPSPKEKVRKVVPFRDRGEVTPSPVVPKWE